MNENHEKELLDEMANQLFTCVLKNENSNIKNFFSNDLDFKECICKVESIYHDSITGKWKLGRNHEGKSNILPINDQTTKYVSNVIHQKDQNHLMFYYGIKTKDNMYEYIPKEMKLIIQI